MNAPSRRLLVAINPTSGVGRGGGVAAEALAELRAAGHDIRPVSAAGAAELARDLTNTLRGAGGWAPEALIVIGGDGMISLALNVLADPQIDPHLPLGLIPSGTGNDFARGLGLNPRRPGEAVQRILDALAHGPRILDLGELRWAGGHRRFAGAANLGFDALVNARANRWRHPRGSLRYVLAMLRELLNLRPREYLLTVDGREHTLSALILTVANNGSIGGGMRIVPGALLDDGILHLFSVSPGNRLRFLLLFPRVFRGTHTGLKNVSIGDLREIHISGGDILAYADGEAVAVPPLSIRVLPGALHMLI
ncbi:diacylglycerol/lipid kinase family protein [Mycetocola spongiae]|uniref:diacylglycerol/lipid kinase family protein n=1 Tax=Mycetocola spongiae TaxID=2859226 RepID=UPI001CF375B3|nr:diacylglycerol kinase family protein [Mycetocola spongiae]UCR89138.1 diacylglycerol kinase [Mycetocola spongiae]